MATVPTPERGEVWLVRFDPSAGAEIRKVRPAVVVNLDAIGRLPLRIVVPVTDWKSDFGNLSWFVFLPAASENGLSKDSGADAFQVKSVSETRSVRESKRCQGIEKCQEPKTVFFNQFGRNRFLTPYLPPNEAGKCRSVADHGATRGDRDRIQVAGIQRVHPPRQSRVETVKGSRQPEPLEPRIRDHHPECGDFRHGHSRRSGPGPSVRDCRG